MSVLVAQVQAEINADTARRAAATRQAVFIVVLICVLCLYMTLCGQNGLPFLQGEKA